MNTSNTAEKGISEIVGVFTDPILVFPGGWGDTLPEWLKNAITLERLAMNVKGSKGEEMTGTDAEACAYLYTAALTQPMDHDWSQIYLYIAGKTYRQWQKDNQLPDDIKVDSLNDYQLAALCRLKVWIYRKRAQMRLDRDRPERKERKEEEAEKRTAERPALFEF